MNYKRPYMAISKQMFEAGIKEGVIVETDEGPVFEGFSVHVVISPLHFSCPSEASAVSSNAEPDQKKARTEWVNSLRKKSRK